MSINQPELYGIFMGMEMYLSLKLENENARLAIEITGNAIAPGI